MSQRMKVRAAVESSMPPLEQACASYKGLAAAGKNSEAVLQTLLAVIQRHRGAKPKRFYTVREVATFFGIGHGTTQRIFRHLGREGALTVVRSSQTMIPARVSRPRLPVHGIVGMPIWLPGFIRFLDWRKLFSQLQEELFRYRFTLEPIFYRLHEDSRPDFAERILKFNPDYVLWNHPSKGDETIMQVIGDAGIPILIIQNIGEPHPFAGRIYWHSYARGLQQGLGAWVASGEMERIILPNWSAVNSATKILQSTLKACPLPHHYQSFPPVESLRGDYSSLRDLLRELADRPKAGIIFDDDLFYSWICAYMTDEMPRLFSRHRALVMREIFLPSLTMPANVTVDTLLLPEKKLAQRIAMDLNQGQIHPSTKKIVFEAQWRPNVPLAESAPRILSE